MEDSRHIRANRRRTPAVCPERIERLRERRPFAPSVASRAVDAVRFHGMQRPAFAHHLARHRDRNSRGIMGDFGGQFCARGNNASSGSTSLTSPPAAPPQRKNTADKVHCRACDMPTRRGRNHDEQASGTTRGSGHSRYGRAGGQAKVHRQGQCAKADRQAGDGGDDRLLEAKCATSPGRHRPG